MKHNICENYCSRGSFGANLKDSPGEKNNKCQCHCHSLLMRLGSCVSETPEIRGCHYVIVPRKHFWVPRVCGSFVDFLACGISGIYSICCPHQPSPLVLLCRTSYFPFGLTRYLFLRDIFTTLLFPHTSWLTQFNRIIVRVVSQFWLMLMVSNDMIVAALVLAFAMHIIFCHAGAWYNMVPHCSLHEFTTSRCITTYHIAAHT